MDKPELYVVTGALGYTGKYITRRLLSMGKRVKTLTGHPDRPNPFGDRVSIAPFNFEQPGALTESLRGAAALVNTYWVRFAHGEVTFDKAVENTRLLIQAARDAGVRRLVHVSITNPSEDSPLPYFRGKGLLEKSIVNSGLSYAIIRPTVIFGPEDILINNIAWLLRNYPVFAVPGSGEYLLQPIFVEDMADLVASMAERDENVVMDAVGPEVYTFYDLVRLIRHQVGSKAKVVRLKPGLALSLSRMINGAVKDVMLTRDEMEGLMANLLISSGLPTGKTHFSQWIEQNAATVGTGYASELSRHYN